MKFNPRIHWIFLAIPILTELLTSNQSFSQLFFPPAFLFFIFAYSLPAFMINDLAIRWHLGFVGIFVLGLAYGIWNEGVLAKTFLMIGPNIPMKEFIGYNCGGINLPWAIMIAIWHSLHSVIYPIAIFRVLYPQESQQSTFSKRGLQIAGIICFLLGSLVHLKYLPGTSIAYLWYFWGAIIGLVLLSMICSKQNQIKWPEVNTPSRLSFASGLLMGVPLVFLLLVMSTMASHHLSMVVQIIADVLVWGFLFLFFQNKKYFTLPAFAFIAMGDYLTQALITAVFVSQRFDHFAGAMIVLILLGYIGFRVFKKAAL